MDFCPLAINAGNAHTECAKMHDPGMRESYQDLYCRSFIMIGYPRVLTLQPISANTADFRPTLAAVRQGPHVTRYTTPLSLSATPTRKKHIVIDITAKDFSYPQPGPTPLHFCYLCGRPLPPWNDICQQHSTSPTRRLAAPRIIPLDRSRIELIETQHMPSNVVSMRPTIQRRVGWK